MTPFHGREEYCTRRTLNLGASSSVSTPEKFEKRAVLRWLRAVEAHLAPRDRALAGALFYAGARISEGVRLDVEDVQLSARKGTLRLLGKGNKVREVPIHPQLRRDLTLWLEERPNWPGANVTPALFLNQRGDQLSVRGASDVGDSESIPELGRAATKAAGRSPAIERGATSRAMPASCVTWPTSAGFPAG